MKKKFDLTPLPIIIIRIWIANPDLKSEFKTDANQDFIFSSGFNPDFGFQIWISDFYFILKPDFGLTSGFDKKHNLNYF
jgi:hypothetical protein